MRRKGHITANNGSMCLAVPTAARARGADTDPGTNPSMPAPFRGAGGPRPQTSAAAGQGIPLDEGDPSAGMPEGPTLELRRGSERLLVVSVHLRTGQLLLATGAAQAAEVGAEIAAALRKVTGPLRG